MTDKEFEIVWTHKAIRHMTVRLVQNGLDEDQAIIVAHTEIESIYSDNEEYKTPEDAADAAYEALADSV